MHVERAFLINLDIRPDRREGFFQRYPAPLSLPPIEVWPAIHGDTCHPPDNWTAGNGAWGCYKTHLNILEYCLNNNVGSYLVFEDDAQFRENFVDYMGTAFTQLPSDWHQFYLGGQLLHEHTHPPVKITPLVYRPYNVNRTHAFAVSRDGMLPMYRWISNLPFAGTEHIDHHLGRLHESGDFNVYCPGQWLVGQGGTSSNVSGNVDEVWYAPDPERFALSHWLYEYPICVVLRSSAEIARLLKHTLHFGGWVDNAGYDRGLSLAAKFAYPGPGIVSWYDCVRAECVRSPKRLIPGLFHPAITDDMISQAGIGKIIRIENPRSAVEAFEILKEKLRTEAPRAYREHFEAKAA